MVNNTIDTKMIGYSIKALRLKAGLTQAELSDRIGYTDRSIRRFEAEGTSNLDVVNSFAEFYQVSALDILNGCFYFIQVNDRYIQTKEVCC